MLTKLHTIEVVFTNRKLETAFELSTQKKYMFLSDYTTKVGDMIISPNYSTPMQIVRILDSSSNIHREGNSFIELKQIIIDSINRKPISRESKQVINQQKTKDMKKNSIFSSIANKVKSQFIPEKEENLRLSMDGNICVPISGEYVGINADDELISYPEAMCLPMPVYTVMKPFSQLAKGDIVKINQSFLKVLDINKNGSIRGLSYSGYASTKREVKDFILGQSLIKVVVNMFQGMSNTTGFNPMMLALAEDNEDFNMKDLMMMQMMQGNMPAINAGNNNPMANPMMLAMMMGNKEGESSDLMETMMMMSMFGQGGNFNPFGNQSNEK